MLLKNLRLAGRLGKAHASFMNGELAEAHDAYINILKADPEDSLAIMVFSGLAEIEQSWGNEERSRYYVELYFNLINKYPDMESNPKLQKQHIKMKGLLNGAN